MRTFTTRTSFLVVLVNLTFLAFPGHDANAAAPRYEVIALSVDGTIFADVSDINNSGQIVGTMFPAGISTGGTYPGGGVNRAFRTDDPVLDRVSDDLGLPSSLQSVGGNSIAIRINNSGQVLAWAGLHAYLIPSGGTLSNATDLGNLSSDYNHANGLNDLGQVVGRINFGFHPPWLPEGNPPWHAYLYTSGSPLKDLGTLGGLYSEAHGINNLGQITGYAENAAREPRAFRTVPNGVIAPADDLGSLGGKYVHGRVINDAGQVAGFGSIHDESASHLFRTGPNAKIDPATDDLGTLPGGAFIEPLDINISGDLVGWGHSSNFVQRAFVVLGSTLYDLNNLIDPSLGITLEVASGINDRGDIVARGTISGSIYSRAFLLKPAVITPPAVSIVSPTDGATFDSCTTATISANASAAGGATITRVDFIANGNIFFGSASSPPYCVSVPDVQVGAFEIVAIAIDSNGNSATSAPVRVAVIDGPPVVDCPNKIMVECSGGLTPVTFEATANDACDGAVPVVCVPPSGSGFPTGTSSITCTATDRGGRSVSCNFIVTVADSTSPTITCPSFLPPVQASDPAGANVSFQVTATENCASGGIILIVNCMPPSGSLFQIGTTTVTCTVGNGSATNSCSFSVTVRGVQTNLPPTAIISSEQLISLSPEFEHPVLISCNWWNACLIAEGWSSSDPEGGDLDYLWFLEGDVMPFGNGPVVTNCLEVGVHTIILSVTDPAGLTDEDRKTLEVVTAPLAIELLIEEIDVTAKAGLARKLKRRLTTTLRVAVEHAGRERLRESQKALDAFEKKVQAQVVKDYPNEAAAWIRWSQAIRKGMEKCITPPRKSKRDDPRTVRIIPRVAKP